MIPAFNNLKTKQITQIKIIFIIKFKSIKGMDCIKKFKFMHYKTLNHM